MTYKWTLAQVDELTWPVISRLLKKIVALPPTDLVVFGMAKGLQGKKQELGKDPLPFPSKKVKKGTLKRRPSG